MRDLVQDMKDFDAKFGFNAVPITKERLAFRLDLINEEVQELRDALRSQNAEEVVDAFVDIAYIAIGSLTMLGVDADRAWSEVHRANMTKERGTKPGREQSGGVDVIKPEGWKAPSHQDNHGKLEELFND